MSTGLNENMWHTVMCLCIAQCVWAMSTRACVLLILTIIVRLETNFCTFIHQRTIQKWWKCLRNVQRFAESSRMRLHLHRCNCLFLFHLRQLCVSLSHHTIYWDSFDPLSNTASIDIFIFFETRYFDRQRKWNKNKSEFFYRNVVETSSALKE